MSKPSLMGQLYEDAMNEIVYLKREVERLSNALVFIERQYPRAFDSAMAEYPPTAEHKA